jgi:hypothetical protein
MAYAEFMRGSAPLAIHVLGEAARHLSNAVAEILHFPGAGVPPWSARLTLNLIIERVVEKAEFPVARWI